MKRFIILKHILSFCICLTCSVAYIAPASAIKAKPGLITYTQPDGSQIEIRLEGNSFCHRATTEDGRRLMITDAGEYRVSPPGHIGNLLMSAPSDATNPQNLPIANGPGLCQKRFPASGTPRVPVILVEYSDRSFSMENPEEFYSRLFNEEGFSDFGATGSVRDWFAENSMGTFTPVFDIYGPAKLSDKMYKYGRNDYWGNEPDAYKIITESAEMLDPEIDFSKYDNDGDGTADLIIALYCGYGEADSARSSAIWPHSFELSKADPENIHTHDGVILDSYICTNETASPYERPAGIGTIVHEFSHALGLPDLYPTVYSTEMPFTPGDWSALDSGPYNNEGRTPPNYSSFERYALGWMQPKRLTEGYKELDGMAVTNQAFFLPCNVSETEYYLFENRRQVGNDLYLPDKGMLVWHVDFDSDKWERNIVNNDGSHLGVDLLQADGTCDREWRAGASFPGMGCITSLGSSTMPALRTWANEPLGYELTEITDIGGIIRFLASASGASADTLESAYWSLRHDGMSILSSVPVKIYSSSGQYYGEGPEVTVSSPGLYIAVDSSGNTRKIML